MFNYGNGNKNPMDNVKLYEKVKTESENEEKVFFLNFVSGA